MDVNCRTFFVAHNKNAPDAKVYPIAEIDGVEQKMEKIISIALVNAADGSIDLEVSSPKVRDYLVRMLNRLFKGVAKPAPAAAAAPAKTAGSKPARGQPRARAGAKTAGSKGSKGKSGPSDGPKKKKKGVQRADVLPALKNGAHQVVRPPRVAPLHPPLTTPHPPSSP